MVSEFAAKKKKINLKKFRQFALILKGKNQRHSVYSSEEGTDLRHTLADFILNVQIPEDLYSILISLVAIYIAWKVFRFSMGVMWSVLRPFFAIFILIVGTEIHTYV